MSIQSIKKIIKAIKEIPNKIEKELDIDEKDLNTIITHDEEYDNNIYDSSMIYRSQFISKGYRIHKMIAVYYQGWECDFWAFIVSKDGKKYKAESNHGHWELTEL